MAKNKKINWDNENTEMLCEAFLVLRNKDEIKNFLRDLLTENEIVEFGHRLQTAKMLKESIHYTTISEKTNLSSRTIARVKKWYKNGRSGYKTVLSRLHR